MGKRGPPPKQLIRLFWLLRENPGATDLEIANKLGVEVETIPVYRWRLKNLLSGITSYCRYCFSKNVWTDRENGERICKSCGYVLEQENSMVHTLPFDETYALTSNIAFGKSLGGTLSRNATYRVLAKTRDAESKTNVPIRQITTITNTFDPPVARNMLSYGSRILKNLGLQRDTGPSAVLAHTLGGTLRKVGGFLAVSKMYEEVQPAMLVRAAVWFTLKRFGLMDEAEECRRKYKFRERDLKLVLKIAELSELASGDLDGQKIVWKAKPAESASWRPDSKRSFEFKRSEWGEKSES